MRTKLIKLTLAALIVASLILPGTQAAFAGTAAAATPGPNVTPSATPAATAKATKQPAKTPAARRATATPVPTATPTPVSPAKSSPEQPLPYTTNWVSIQPGEWHWYAFKYSYDRSSDSTQTPAQLRLQSNPGEGVSLMLLNGEQVKAWESGQKLAGFGAATPRYTRTRVREDIGDFCDNNPDDPACTNDTTRQTSQCDNVNDPTSIDKTCNYWNINSSGYASWTGVIGASGEYYILVRRDSNTSGPVQYQFTMSGDGLTMK